MSEPTHSRSPFSERENADFSLLRVVYGRNPVKELLETETRIDRIFLKRGEREGFLTVLAAKALEKRIPISEADKSKLDKMAEGGNHQGVVALVSPVDFLTLDRLEEQTRAEGKEPFFVLLDGIEDPHNFGAIARSCECAGVNGLILPRHRTAPLSAVAAKASAGALAHLPIARVANLTAAIKQLQSHGVWVYAAEASGEYYGAADLSGPIAFVFGSEGSGVSRLVLETCDKTISIPLHGKINSLNVSAAAAVILFAAEKCRSERASQQE